MGWLPRSNFIHRLWETLAWDHFGPAHHKGGFFAQEGLKIELVPLKNLLQPSYPLAATQSVSDFFLFLF